MTMFHIHMGMAQSQQSLPWSNAIYQELDKIEEEEETLDDVFSVAEHFFLVLYGHMKTKNITEAWYQLFKNKKIDVVSCCCKSCCQKKCSC